MTPVRLNATLLACAVLCVGTAWAGTSVQVGPSGKTFASSAVQCVAGQPMVQAGLLDAKPSTSGLVSLGSVAVETVTAADPSADVWLAAGANTVVVSVGKKVADRYAFNVGPYACSLPDTSGNSFSADGTLELAASGKSSATVTPGCALSAKTGQPQPYVHLFDNGGYLLNVSVNGVPLTQLSAQRPHTPVFLAAGLNVIAAAHGSLSTDHFVRDGGDGRCVLTP